MPLVNSRRARRAWAAACAAIAVLLVAAPLAAQQVDVIRGRVTGPDRAPVENASVTATSVSGNVNRSARTDRNGRFTITFPGGDGDYMVSVASLGFAPRRFEVKRLADEDFLVADARLQRATTQLDTVTVLARDRVRRGQAGEDISGSERRVDQSAVAAEQMGNLAAMAASVPGVTPVAGADGDPAGFSVLGLSADQNQTTMNGMNMGGGDLPRDAGVGASLVTSPWDVSTGGFSGGRFNVSTRPGSNYVTRAGSLYGTAPQAQWADAAARALGQRSTSLSLGGSASGPIVFDRAFYNVAWQLGRTANDLRTLLNTSAAGLQAAGVAADSVRRLEGILGRQQVPTTFPGLRPNRLNDQGSLFGAFDASPARGGGSFNVTANGGWSRQTAASQLATEFPAHSGDRTAWNGGLQGRHSSYVRNVLLSETQVGASRTRSWATPYVALPSGSVLVLSAFDDGTSSLRPVSFGGNPFMNTGQTATNVGATNQLSWFSASNRHRLKLASELRREGYAQDVATNLLGSFTYNSLADLDAGRPASYSRQLSPRERSGGQLVGALSLGDSYKRSSTLQLQYGVRLDANRFDGGPAANDSVRRAFGAPNDAVPNHVYASPRVGFSWAYGTAPQVAGFEGAVRGPRAVVRGGVGVFQNVPGTTLLGAAIDNTGLPGALQQLTCVGPAAPAPAWAAYGADPSSIPGRCADGTTGSVFASTVPNVTLFSRDYEAPRSLRSNLSWAGPVLGNRFSLNVDGTVAINRNQPGFVDLNFTPARRFALADEGGRPVYVRPSSIVAATGAVASRDARVSQQFARVLEQRSDLRSESRQLQLGLSPVKFGTSWRWSLNYTLADAREQSRGFTSTAGDPLAVEWSRSAFQPRHAVNYTLFYNLADAVRLSWSGVARSGLPFTPQVAGDVNGDGYVNDRAFVASPSGTADPLLAEGMRALLADGSREARECLVRQLGTIAGRASCRGPWTHAANLSVSFNPLKLRLPQRATLSFGISNPIGAADQILHGEGNLRGWGQTAFPDATLLQVVGFDPAAQRYRYAVNQRFGSTRPAQSAFRQPVTVTARLNFDVGPTRERQNLTQMLDRGRRHDGQKMPEAVLRSMYGSAGGIVNPIEQVLRQADSLRLTGPQADSVATMNRWYKLRLDSIWAPVARALAALPDDYDQGDAYARYITARRATVDVLTRLAPAVNGLLTAEQRRKLPPFIASYLDARYLASIRSGTAGASTGGMPVMMGGPMGGMSGMPMGGGGNVIIVR